MFSCSQYLSCFWCNSEAQGLLPRFTSCLAVVGFALVTAPFSAMFLVFRAMCLAFHLTITGSANSLVTKAALRVRNTFRVVEYG